MSKINEELIPLDGLVLNAVNCDCLELSAKINDIQAQAAKMAKHAHKLSEHDAAILFSTTQVHNIKRAASNAYMYIGLADMLLDHIKDDLNKLYNERDKFCTEQAERIQARQNAERQSKYRRKEAAETE